MGREAIQFRSLNEFFESGTFSIPVDSKEITERVDVNARYYFPNYALIFGVCMMYAAIATPPFGFAMAVVGGLAFWLWGVRPRPTIPTGESGELSQMQSLAVFGVSAVILLSYNANRSCAVALSIALIAVLAHMLLRQRSLKARGTVAVDEAKKSTIASIADAIGDLVDGAGKSGGSGKRSVTTTNSATD